MVSPTPNLQPASAKGELDANDGAVWRVLSELLPWPTAWIDLARARVVWANRAFAQAVKREPSGTSWTLDDALEVEFLERALRTSGGAPASVEQWGPLHDLQIVPGRYAGQRGVLVTSATAALQTTHANSNPAAHESVPVSIRSLMDMLPIGVYVCNADARISHFNQKAAELWGRTPKLLDPDHMYCGSLRLFTANGEPLPHDQTPMATALRTQSPIQDHEVIVERPDGSRHVALVNIAPLFTEHGRFAGAVNCFQDVTKRKHAEDRMRDEMHFREAVESCMPAGITAIGLDRRLIYANREFCTMVGWDRDELLGMAPPFPYWDPDDADTILAVVDAAIAGAAPETGHEFTFRRRNGEPFEVLLRSAPLRDGDGRIEGCVTSISDITTRKRAERTTRFLMDASIQIAHSLDYETILENVANLVVPAFGDWCAIDVLQSDGTIQHVAVAHSDPERIRLAHQIQRGYPLATQSGGIARVMRSGEPRLVADVTDEMLVTAAQDATHLALMRQVGARSMMLLPLNARGRILGALTIISAESGRRYTNADLDVMEELARHCAIAIDKAQLYGEAQRELHERRRAEEALRLSEERLRFTLDSASVGTWDWDIISGKLQWSENLCKIHGIEPNALSGTFDDFARDIHPDDRSRVLTAVQHAIEREGAFDIGYRLNRADGPPRWVEGKGRVIIDNGKPVAMAGICMDVTERRLLEERFRIAVEASPNAFVMVDGDGVIAMVNTQTERLFKYTREELVGQSVEMLVPERYRARHPVQRQQFLSNPHARPMGAGRDLFCVRRDGTEFPVEIGLSPVQMPEGTFVLSAIVDITERKRNEDAIRRANEDLLQKNREMEQFVYTVSHDLKSPIVTAMGFIGMLREDLEVGTRDEVDDSINRIERATTRMSELIDDLLELSRIGRVCAEPEAVDPAGLIGEIVDEMGERIADAGAEIRIQPGLPMILVDRKRFYDLVENLLTNALKYGCSNASPLIEIGAHRSEQEVRFFVRDNGPGIAPEYHTRIFDLFQRLQNDQEGTGVGLAIVARVAEVHGGRVWVESTPGHGATFWFTLSHDRILQ